MTITKLLCLTAVIGLSYGHVHRARRETAGMTPMLKDEDGNSIMGMYFMADPPTFRNEPQSCKVQYNRDQDEYDYDCGCNQRLGMGRPISNLILNHTECKSSLRVFWSEFESSLKPKSITFVGITMTLTNQTVNEEASHIKKLTFSNSIFSDLTEDAFKGLNILEELRFLDDCKIINISENAVRNHEKLHTIEMVKSVIGTINENAFLNLPTIKYFAISSSVLDEMKVRGINLNTASETVTCGRTGRNLKMLETCIESLIEHSAQSVHDPNDSETVMSRQIQGARGVDLPKSGNQFILLKNKIHSIRSKAVNSNMFGFLILGGNKIKLIESEAFNMQLHNPCEISAALFASNNITKLSDKSLAGISNKLYSNNNTFVALKKNKFDEVQAHSFQIERSIQIVSVDENIFNCECMNLSGFLQDQKPLSSVQAELKMKIIEKANCTTGVDLTTFKHSCEYSSGSKSTFSHSNLTNVVVTGFIMILINKIVP